MLEDAPWQFARKIEALAVLSSVDLFNWNFAYQYPADCLRIDRLLLDFEKVNNDSAVIASRLYDFGLPQPDLRQPVEYQIYEEDGNKVIGSNESDLRAQYTVKVTDPNKFTTKFIMSLSRLLAANIASSLVGDKRGDALETKNLQIYNSYIMSAAADDANEQHLVTPDSEYITSRG